MDNRWSVTAAWAGVALGALSLLWHVLRSRSEGARLWLSLYHPCVPSGTGDVAVPLRIENLGLQPTTVSDISSSCTVCGFQVPAHGLVQKPWMPRSVAGHGVIEMNELKLPQFHDSHVSNDRCPSDSFKIEVQATGARTRVIRVCWAGYRKGE